MAQPLDANQQAAVVSELNAVRSANGVRGAVRYSSALQQASVAFANKFCTNTLSEADVADSAKSIFAFDKASLDGALDEWSTLPATERTVKAITFAPAIEWGCAQVQCGGRSLYMCTANAGAPGNFPTQKETDALIERWSLLSAPSAAFDSAVRAVLPTNPNGSVEPVVRAIRASNNSQALAAIIAASTALASGGGAVTPLSPADRVKVEQVLTAAQARVNAQAPNANTTALDKVRAALAADPELAAIFNAETADAAVQRLSQITSVERLGKVTETADMIITSSRSSAQQKAIAETVFDAALKRQTTLASEQGRIGTGVSTSTPSTNSGNDTATAGGTTGTSGGSNSGIGGGGGGAVQTSTGVGSSESPSVQNELASKASDFLTQPASMPVWGWILIAVGVLILLIIVIVLAVTASSAKSTKERDIAFRSADFAPQPFFSVKQ